MKAIEVENLTFNYDEKSFAIDHLNLTIEAGKYVAIVGHNGSGKSTLAKLLLGLLEAKEGTIKIFGETLTEETSNKIRQKVGIVFQNPDNQFIGSTVAEDIAFGLENRQIPHDEMVSLINEFSQKVNMADFLEKEPGNLSGGQKQRVAIAGVLAMHPDMIIFDEATVMLDPKGRKEIRDLIMQMRKEQPNLTLISITHDMEEALSADEVVIMDHGRVVAQGDPNTVFKYEQLLNSIDLKMPFLFELHAELLKNGIDVPQTSDFEEMVINICRLK